jgi:hypothetical protein
LLRFPPVEGRIVFADTEFTTLDKMTRQVWEIGAIIRDPGRDPGRDDIEVEWQIRPDLTYASPDSLRIGRYHKRCRVQDRPVGDGVITVGPGFPELGADIPLGDDRRRVSAAVIAATVAQMMEGATLVGAVISADETALEQFLRQHGQVMSHHYRIRCVETIALGYVNGRLAALEEAVDRGWVGDDRAAQAAIELRAQIPAPPYDPKTLSRLCGMEPPPPDQQHRALVDARWARDVWDAVHGRAAGPGPGAAR